MLGRKTDQRQKNISRELGQTKISRENITKTDLMMAFGRTQSWEELAKIFLFFFFFFVTLRLCMELLYLECHNTLKQN